MSMLM